MLAKAITLTILNIIILLFYTIDVFKNTNTSTNIFKIVTQNSRLQDATNLSASTNSSMANMALWSDTNSSGITKPPEYHIDIYAILRHQWFNGPHGLVGMLNYVLIVFVSIRICGVVYRIEVMRETRDATLLQGDFEAMERGREKILDFFLLF